MPHLSERAVSLGVAKVSSCQSSHSEGNEIDTIPLLLNPAKDGCVLEKILKSLIFMSSHTVEPAIDLCT